MCAPYSGCQPSNLKEVSVRYSSESGAQVVENPAVIPGLGQFVDYVWALKTERDTLLAQVTTLQSAPDSYQSGFDAGRKHYYEECKRLRALLGRCQEMADPHRDAVLWDDLCTVLRVKP
jgi:hypothetical protein